MTPSDICLNKIFIVKQSAKTNMNVEEVFFSIARDIKQRLAESDSNAEVSSVSFIHLCLPVFHMCVQYGHRCLLLSKLSLSLSMQPQSIRITQQDQAGGAAQAAQKSACCGS